MLKLGNGCVIWHVSGLFIPMVCISQHLRRGENLAYTLASSVEEGAQNFDV